MRTCGGPEKILADAFSGAHFSEAPMEMRSEQLLGSHMTFVARHQYADAVVGITEGCKSIYPQSRDQWVSVQPESQYASRCLGPRNRLYQQEQRSDELAPAIAKILSARKSVAESSGSSQE